VREAATIWARPLQVDLWPFDLQSGVRVTCDVGYTSVSILVFLGLSGFDLGPMDVTDVRRAHRRLMHLILGAGHNNFVGP